MSFFLSTLYYRAYNFVNNVEKKSVIFDGDDYSEPIPKDLIIRKPTPPTPSTPPSPGQLGKLYAIFLKMSREESQESSSMPNLLPTHPFSVLVFCFGYYLNITFLFEHGFVD